MDSSRFAWLRALPSIGIVAAATAVGTGGCGTQNRAVAVRDSPIAKMASLDSPAPVPRGSVGINATGTVDHRRSGYFDEPDLRLTKYGGAARVRVGAAQGLELQAEGAAYQWRVGSSLCDEDSSGSSFKSVLATGRGGVKFAPPGTEDFFSVTMGVGGGGTRTGTFLSPDIGLSLGYERGPVVPFGQLELLGSFPIAQRTVVGVDCQSGDSLYAELDPTNVFKGRGTFGIKIPFAEAGSDGSLHTLVQMYVAGVINVGGYASGGAIVGFEVVFGKTPARPNRRRPPAARPAAQPAPAAQPPQVAQPAAAAQPAPATAPSPTDATPDPSREVTGPASAPPPAEAAPPAAAAPPGPA